MADTSMDAASHGWSAQAIGWNGFRMHATAHPDAAKGSPSSTQGSGEQGADRAKRRGTGRAPRTSIPCQVPGCKAELVDDKGYYKKYRICRQHCTASCIVLEGQEKRFCRPCGQFHAQELFHGSHASCRRQLERRRLAAAARNAKKSPAASSPGGTATGGSSARPSSGGDPASFPGTSNGSGGAADGAPKSGTCRTQEAPTARQAAPLAGPGGSPPPPPAPPAPLLDLILLNEGLAGVGPQELALGLDGGSAACTPSDADMDDADAALAHLVAEVGGAELVGLAWQDVAEEGSAGLPSGSGFLPGGSHAGGAGPPLSAEHLQPGGGAALSWSSPASSAHTLPGPVPYNSSSSVVRLSLKLFNVTPDLLLPEVKEELEAMLGVGPMLLDSFIRPGCLHLTLSVLMSLEEERSLCSLPGLVEKVQYLVERKVFGESRMLVQASNLLAVVRPAPGPSQALLCTTDLDALSFHAIRPLCTLAGASTHTLHSVGLDCPKMQLFCRQQGQNLTLEVLARAGPQDQRRPGPEPGPSGSDRYSSSSSSTAVEVLGLELGFAEVEVQLGGVLSAPRAILVLPDPQAVAEVRTLESCPAGIPDVDAFLRNTGLVVQYLYRHQTPGAQQYEGLYTPALLRRLAALAREVVVVAISRGWPALARLLLPATTAGGDSPGVALSSMDALCPTTLLDAAVASGSGEAGAVLAEWAAAQGVDLEPTEKPATQAEPRVLEAGASKPAAAKPAAGRGGALEAGRAARGRFLPAYFRRQLWLDIMVEWFGIVTCTTICLRFLWADGLEPSTHLALKFFAGVVLGGVTIALAHRPPAWFLGGWRSAWLVGLRLVRSLLFVLHSERYNSDHVHPLALPQHPARTVAHLLRPALLAVISAFGHPLTLGGNVLSALSFLLPVLVYQAERCSLECTIPEQKERYEGLLAAAERLHGGGVGWRGAPAGASGDEPTAACAYGCLAVNGWILLYIGAVLPVWVLAVKELGARRQWRGRGAPSARSLALHAAGMALASAPCLLLAKEWARLEA